MKRKYFNIGLIIFFILFVFVLPKFCSNEMSLYKIYKNENLPLEIEGKVIDIELYKGGNITLTLQSKKRKSIAINSKMKNVIRLGDYFEKHSNKCIIIRNDSIYHFDCFNIPPEIRDSLDEIEEWPRDIVEKWQLQNEN